MMKPVSDSDFVVAIDDLTEKLRNFAQLVRTLSAKEGERRTRSHTPAFERGWDDLCAASKPVRKAIRSRANFPHGTRLTSAGMLAGYAREFEAELDGAIAQVVVWSGYTRRDADGVDVYEVLMRRPNGESVDIAYQSIPADWVERADAALAMLGDHRKRLASPKSGLRNQSNSDSRNRLKMTTRKVAAELRKIRAAGEAFSSERKLGIRLGCGGRTVGKAVASDIGLRAWRKESEQKKPRVVGSAFDEMDRPSGESIDPPEDLGETPNPAEWNRFLDQTAKKKGQTVRRQLESLPPKWRARAIAQAREEASRGGKGM
jgi:hypothetical protein